MPVNKPHLYQPGIYFITFTNFKWLLLFELTNAYDLVYKWFDILQQKGHHVTGYVIMPNHIHALIGFTPGTQSINTMIGNAKRFMAYDIVNRLKLNKSTDILSVLSAGVSTSDKNNGKLHEVFKPSFDAKLCHSYAFINQKLNYIHNNPVSKKWDLVQFPGDYTHSSAGFYETGRHGVYNVIHVTECIEKYWFEQYRRT